MDNYEIFLYYVTFLESGKKRPILRFDYLEESYSFEMLPIYSEKAKYKQKETKLFYQSF